MPPQFFQEKMQAFVKSSNPQRVQAASQEIGSPPKIHIYQGQSAPLQEKLPAQTHAQPQYQPQYSSRASMVNANVNRMAAAAAARMPTSRSGTSRSGHARDASLNAQRSRTVSSDPPLRQHQHGPPFWEGSTVDGSVFSDSASTAEPRPPSQLRMHLQDPHRQRNTPRQLSTKNGTAEPEGGIPYAIGDNGMIDTVKTPLVRSTSTPDARARANFEEFSQDSGSLADESLYQGSPEKTIPNSLNHHRARMPLRTNNPGSFAERTSYPSARNGMSSPVDPAYRTPAQGYEDAPTQNAVHLSVSERDTSGHRGPTVFENPDTPIASQGDMEDGSADDDERQLTPTPKKTVRQLFANGSKGKNSLHESAVPRQSTHTATRPSTRPPTRPPARINIEKQQSTPKKRQHDADYDDSVLAAMKYDELKNQDFDFDPAQAESQSAQNPSKTTLPEKLRHFSDKGEAAQASFFTTMPIKDWNDSGDWFLDQFGDIMKRFRDARQAKRQLVDNFEGEIAEREAAVRTKISGIGLTLNKLKSEGEGLMKNKQIE